MKTKFIIIRGITGYIIPFLFKDIETMKNAEVRKGNILFKTHFQYYIYKLHNSKRINQLFELPGKKFWLKKELSFLENYNFKNDTKYFIIILNLAANTLAFPRIEGIKRDNIKLILAFFDPVSDNFASKLAFENKDYFDLIMTFDTEDAIKYGFKHFFQRYSKFDLCPSEKDITLYFIGHSKGRFELLEAIGRELDKKEILYCFKVVGYGGKKIACSEGIKFLKKSLSYLDVLKDVARSSCLLEIVQNGQSGATARYTEAICYNKKLLTNNKNIVNFPYYDNRYMKIFSGFEDIDYNWLFADMDINYGYNGEFSPVKMLETIEGYFE